MLKARFFVTVSVALLLGLLLAPTAAHAVAGNGKVIEPMFCETGSDSAVIGTVSVDLGGEALVPVYVESDDCIDNFRFVFIFPTNLDYLGVEPGSWPNGWDPPVYNATSRTLVVEHSTGGTCMTPDVADAFLYLRVTTHCKSVHNTTLPITWGFSDPENPSVFLGHSACNRDPIAPTRSGSVFVNRITIMFDISEETGLIGDEVLVTLICENSYLFGSFTHRITWNPDVLAPLSPFVVESPRTTGATTESFFGSVIFVSGSNAGGFGTSASDGLLFYQMRFQVISPTDDVSGAVSFLTGPYVNALDCNQALHTMYPQVVIPYGGSITVPAYSAEFDLGEAAWNNASTCEFTAPILLKNNYPVTRFQLAVEYSADAGLPLTTTGVASFDPLNWPLNWGGNQLCGLAKYTIVETYGEANYPPSEEFRVIGWIKFQNPAPSAQQLAYTLRVLEFGCGTDDPTWAETRDDIRDVTRYDFADPQLTGIDGSVTVGNPLAEVAVPSATAECHKPPIPMECDHFANTGLLVRANADLDYVQFNVTWNGNLGCVDFQDLDPSVQVLAQQRGFATLRVNNVAASPNWKSFGTVRVTNGKYYDLTMQVTTSAVTATESCTHGPIAGAGMTGSFGLYALKVQYVSCIPDIYGEKVSQVPDRFELIQNHPNPFNAATLIDFSLSEGAHTRLEVFNIMGQRVRTLMNDYTEAGRYSILWDGRDSDGRVAASGVYLYRLESGSLVSTKKMVLLK